MKLFFRFLILVFGLVQFCSLQAQQYYTNTYVDTTILSDTYDNINCTLPFAGGKITLDTSLYNYVTGLRFVVVFDSVSGAVLTGGSQIHNGDTFQLNAANSVFNFILGSGTPNCRYRVVVTGTPTVVNQSYRCSFKFDVCTCYCPRDFIISTDTTKSFCQVGIGSGISKSSSNEHFRVQPNPAKNLVEVFGNYCSRDNYRLTITDVTGRNVYTWLFSNTSDIVDVSAFSSGLYLVSVTDKDGNIMAATKLVKE